MSFYFPIDWCRSTENHIWHTSYVRLLEGVSENWHLERKTCFWEQKREECNNEKYAGGERKGKEWQKCVSRQAWLVEKKQTLPLWQDFGWQNSSGGSLIVKLSVSKKMEEITHSLCLWEETVIAVNFWIKYDWMWDFKRGRNICALVCWMDRCLFVHLFFSPWLLFYAEPSPSQADVTCHELNMGPWSCVSLGGNRKELLICH